MSGRRKMQKQLRKSSKQLRKMKNRVRELEQGRQDNNPRGNVPATRPILVVVEETHITEEYYRVFAVPPKRSTPAQTQEEPAPGNGERTASTDDPVCARDAG